MSPRRVLLPGSPEPPWLWEHTRPAEDALGGSPALELWWMETGGEGPHPPEPSRLVWDNSEGPDLRRLPQSPAAPGSGRLGDSLLPLALCRHPPLPCLPLVFLLHAPIRINKHIRYLHSKPRCWVSFWGRQ